MIEVTQNANHIELIAICCDERLKLKLPDFQYLQTTVIILSLVLNMLQIKNIFWALLYTLKATTSTPSVSPGECPEGWINSLEALLSIILLT